MPDNVRNQSESLVPPLHIPSLEHGSTWREDEHERRASAHPHGEQICASGCAASRHPTEKLEKQLFDELIHRWEHLGDSEAFDELLYFGPQTRARLMQLNSLSSRLRTLARELERDRVRVELRLITREGKVLADLPPQIVPFDIRHEFDLREFGIPQLVASGTVKRVGVDRLWGRL